jgi:hypothetical protein
MTRAHNRTSESNQPNGRQETKKGRATDPVIIIITLTHCQIVETLPRYYGPGSPGSQGREGEGKRGGANNTQMKAAPHAGRAGGSGRQTEWPGSR